jgi:hypothetical protein
MVSAAKRAGVNYLALNSKKIELGIAAAERGYRHHR